MKSCEVCNAQKDKFPEANCCSKSNIWRQGNDFRCFTCGKDIVPPVMNTTNKNWKPMKNESAEDYVERVGGWHDPDNSLVQKIEHYYKVERGESRKLLLSSRSFWERLFNEHTKGIFERGGSRYGALRYIQRKNDFLRGGKKIFSQLEIDEILDGAGKWKR